MPAPADQEPSRKRVEPSLAAESGICRGFPRWPVPAELGSLRCVVALGFAAVSGGVAARGALVTSGAVTTGVSAGIAGTGVGEGGACGLT